MDAREITVSLGGRWQGQFGTAPCPVCQGERRKGQNALTLADGDDGRLLAHCKKSACSFVDIITALGLRDGSYAAPSPHEMAARKAEAAADQKKKLERCRQIWDQAKALAGTKGEAYLRGRGIQLPLAPSLRWRSDIFHSPSGAWVSAIIAKIEPTGAVHRTFFLKDGTRDKLMFGPCSGGAVRLADGSGPLVVGEGIESTLSALQLLDQQNLRAWAGLNTSGMRGLTLPKEPGELILAVDGDAPGRAAGADLAERATALGWSVSTADPGDGLDWNDRLIEEVAA
ncbi:MAG: toprim domain-containing protein [Pseudomonadota bacterium]